MFVFPSYSIVFVIAPYSFVFVFPSYLFMFVFGFPAHSFPPTQEPGVQPDLINEISTKNVAFTSLVFPFYCLCLCLSSVFAF